MVANKIPGFDEVWVGAEDFTANEKRQKVKSNAKLA